MELELELRDQARHGAGPEAPAQEAARRGCEMLALFDVEGYEEAAFLFREAIESSRDFAPAYAGLAETYAYWGFRREINGQEHRSLYDMAVEYADMALRLAPERGDSHRAMALALRRGPKADPVRRQEEAQTAADLDPNDAETWCELWRARGYDPNDPALRQTLALDPLHCGVRIDLGVVYCELGRFDEALEQLVCALKVNPRNSLALYDMAMVLDRKGLRDKAVEVLLKAREMHPEEPLIRTGLELLGG